MNQGRAVIFVVWGESEISRVFQRTDWSFFENSKVYLFTDEETEIPECAQGLPSMEIKRLSFQLQGLPRKTEFYEALPHDVETFLLLDSDTRVLADISLGFEKARQHGIAIAPAPHYSLDHFGEFRRVLEAEQIPPAGHIQYNTGVIFFSRSTAVDAVFRRWHELVVQYLDDVPNDQPFFTLALEQCGFNPYALSRSYNYRAMGEPISGLVRIWHSRYAPPEGINQFQMAWPPRSVDRNWYWHPEQSWRYQWRQKRKEFRKRIKNLCWW